ncbi:sensor histidine kinase [Leifsonia flava]|uniref:histidine kinase n=1 Tax=Orlajensenia leifsoniae TaxID=2561933 RepID=A0A4Y9R3R0_9MICO|nr:histidine kinase [Leifsonia flava]TFV99241.1 sensor histidine kinase [Leifsonia flava]
MTSPDPAPVLPGRTPGDGLIRRLPARSLAFDLSAAVILFLVSLGVTAAQGAASVVALVVLCSALAIRRVSPALALTVAWLGAVLQLVTLSDPGAGDIAICGVLYATAAYGSRLVRWLGLGSAVLGTIIATTYLVVVQPALRGQDTATIVQPTDGSRIWIITLFFGIGILALLGLSWTLGLLARTVALSRTARVEARIADERAQYEVAVEQERTRIARDMHDVVAHSLAVVIAQADGARYAASVDPSSSDVQGDALVTIAQTARTALGNVRLLLAELRHDASDSPQPRLEDIDVLVEQLRATGMNVEVTRQGEPQRLGAGQEIAAYRIVQEALTNALRHGEPEAPVLLELGWRDDALAIHVENAVRPDAATLPVTAFGHGLPGMRERATLAGGTLLARRSEADPTRFVVEATIPVSTGGVS